VRATAVIAGETVTQLRRVSAQDTFGGQNSPTVHFGLSDADRITELVFYWPSGLVETVTDVAPNQTVRVVEGEGFGGITIGTEGAEPPGAFRLEGHYPDPFNTLTTIRYTLSHSESVVLTIYDLQGRVVRTLVDAVRPAGAETVTWDGTSDAGLRVGAGVYLYTLRAGNRATSRLMTLLK
jgi:hypothetical protein